MLLRRIAGGDRQALAHLYRRHGPSVLAHITMVVDDRSLSEEVLQDTMLAVWRGAASFRGEAKVRTWLIAIARRQIRDRLRRKQLVAVDESALNERPAWEPGPEKLALDRIEVANAMGTLGLRHREVLGLVFGAGLTLAEVAELLEVPIGTIKSRLAASRTALMRALNERD
jgi:RNA polymerase sigma-70 factor (ECF subfamily)